MTKVELTRRLRAAGCIFAEREAKLLTQRFSDDVEREQAVRRRETGEPLEYVVGQANFDEVTVAIGPPGFIPRARAGALLDAVDATDPGDDVTALDLGCGVGALAAALTRRHPPWTVVASDVDEDALGWARRNGETFGFTVYAGSWFDALPISLRGGIDVVVAHLPYVPTAEMARLPRDFRNHEPSHTVDGGADGLDPLRAVAGDSVAWLSPPGFLVTQVSIAQRAAAEQIAHVAGLRTEVAQPRTVGEDMGSANDEDWEQDTIVLVLRPQPRPVPR